MIYINHKRDDNKLITKFSFDICTGKYYSSKLKLAQTRNESDSDGKIETVTKMPEYY